MGGRPARSRDCRICMAHHGGGSLAHFQRATRADVGDRAPPPRGGSRRPANRRWWNSMRKLLMTSFVATSVALGAQDKAAPNVDQLNTMTARFAPVDLSADVSKLPANERQALAKLVEAATVMDTLFLRQVWAGNETMLLNVLQDTSDIGRARLHYFLLNKGPWSRLDHNESFIPGAPPKPEQANFYPADATKQEVEDWFPHLSGSQKHLRTGFYSTI